MRHSDPSGCGRSIHSVLLPASSVVISLYCGMAYAEKTHESAAALPTLQISGEPTGDNNVDGYIARESSAATKTNTAIAEVPQSITVITREQINDQNPMRAIDALRYTPGITPEVYGGNTRSDTYTMSRGIGLDYYVNDLPVPAGKNYAGWAIDPYLIERAEFLRGPSSILYGQASPGGVLNYVTKQPTFDEVREIHLEYGSDEWKKLGIDLGGALGNRNNVAYRLVIAGLDADQSYDPKSNTRLTIAPSLTWQVNDDTALTVMAGYYDEDSSNNSHFLPAEGTVLSSPYGKIDRDFITSQMDFETYQKQEYWLGYQFSHQLNNDWQFRQHFRYARTKTHLKTVYSGVQSIDTGSTRLMARVAADTKPDYNRYSLDNQLEGHFESAQGIRHTLLMGANYEQGRTRDPMMYGQAQTLDIYNPIYLPTLDHLETPLYPDDQTGKLRQIGLYLQDQIRFGDHWALTMGGRYDWARTELINEVSDTRTAQHDTAFSARAGLVYLTDMGLNPYISYSESFQPQVGHDANGEAFDPSEGKQWETGLKYAPDHLDWELTAAVFDIRRTNLPTDDLLNPGEETLTGEVRSRGAELSAVGRITPNIDIRAAYTYQEVTNRKMNDETEGKRRPTVPRQMASLWGKYTQHSGRLQGLGIGVGIRHVGESTGDNNNSFDVPSFTLLDAALSYRWDPNWKILLNITNLTDKEYIDACSNRNSCFYGPERRLVGSVTYSW